MRALALAALLATPTLVLIEVSQARADGAASDTYGYQSGIDGYFRHWFDRVDAAQAGQPHWIPPLVTTTPRLLEAVRYDQYWEHASNGTSTDVYDGNHFLELIPTTTSEVLINPPAYESVHGSRVSGWGDWPFLVVKQRLLSANEQQGNYMLTGIVGFQVPSGNSAFTNHAAVITPSISGGKGWGDFDVQATLGFPIPTAHDATIGYSATLIGAGYQFAVSPQLTRTPVLTPVYNRAWIVSARLLF